MLTIILTLAVLAATIGYFCIKKSPESRKWIKYFLNYAYLRLTKKKPLFNFAINPDDLGQFGVISLPIAWIKENPRVLAPNIHAVDSIRIWGANKEGALLYLQLSRKHNRVSEVTLFLRLDEDYTLPIYPETNVYNTDGKTFTASGLTIEVLEPLRRWTINFNGYLRKRTDGSIVTANFNFLCIPSFNVATFPEDFNLKCLANYLTTSEILPWEFYDKLSLERQSLFGQLNGLVNIQGEPEREILLRGIKERTFGTQDWENLNHLIYIEICTRIGTSVRLFIENNKNGLNKFICGYVNPPCNMTLLHIECCKTNVDAICSSSCPTEIDVEFKAGGLDFVLHVQSRDVKPFKTYIGDKNEAVSILHHCDVTLNGKPGEGIIHFMSSQGEFVNKRSIAKQISLPMLTEPEIDNCEELILAFNELKCRSSNLVGGKGASLAMMTSIQNYSDEEFQVPPGVSITKTAFQLQIEQNPKISHSLNSLLQIAKSALTESSVIENQCEKLVELITNTTVSPRLREELREKLNEVFGEDYESIRFAVRSSAIGEDGEEMSAAGQNETFLGVRGFDEICLMISKCWASQFAFRSVEYKRQNAQLLNGGMGVVIQQMVPAEVAGVLFSRHPLTGSPTQMVITANYGLGESVVSATADPDTIMLSRSYDDKLSVDEVTTGSKKSNIQMSEAGGTIELETKDDEASKCSVNDKDAIRLGLIAVYLEKLFGNGRDIEWAINKDKIFILQSRPVTTNSAMSEFEIIHEFDAPLRTDREFFSTANVAEVMPGAQTTLTATSVMRGQMPFFQKIFQWKMDIYKFDPIVFDGWGCYYGHTMFDLVTQKAWDLKKEKTAVMKAFDIGIYGKILDDSEIAEVALERYAIRPPMRQRLIMTMSAFKGMLIGKSILNRVRPKYSTYRVPLNGTEDIQETYDKIGAVLPDIFPMMDAHLSVTMGSTMWNMFTLNILSQSSGTYSNDQYSDFALLVGSCNGAESGNVPASLGELAMVISKASDLDDFAKISPEEALEKLNNTSDATVKLHFQEFLKRHGHRGLKEFDLSCRSWGIEPKQVIVVLQGMLSNGTYNIPKPQEKTLDEIIAQLKSPLSFTKKWMLKFIMKFCRTGVCHRENAKSMLIKYFDAVRLAFRHLAKLLMEEGYIMDEELIFFFTYEELGTFIKTRSPKLLRRAKQRKKTHKTMDKFKFPEMIEGIPKPISEQIQISAVDAQTIIKGVPVSQGIIQGPARVVKSFHEVHTIRPGEILITHATDIGWSPYFPMISGIVTEIGGLISHGAVVAREFGLPCIVGIENATKLFQSGDIVLLNATQGTIMKVSNSEEQSAIANNHH